ncbi:MAG TPA: ABC transporter substrate-binding protein [Burkholderiaceae bacterium]|nr:ABC transporter substrate-binding protein [Burkholderiaceae bacterium]
MMCRIAIATAWLVCFAAPLTKPATAQSHYDPGANDTEIRIGNVRGSTPHIIIDAEAAYFRMINDGGGINGRKITFISEESGPDAGEAIAHARHLVDDEDVLALFSTAGFDQSLAIRTYANENKIPQVFVLVPSTAFADPSHFPWTMGMLPTNEANLSAFARYVKAHRPNPKIAVLHEATARGSRYAAAFREGLGKAAATMIVKEATIKPDDGLDAVSIESLKESGADVLVNLTWGGLTRMVVQKTYDLGWRPLQFLPLGTIGSGLWRNAEERKNTAGLIISVGLGYRAFGPMASTFSNDPETVSPYRNNVSEYHDWMAKYNPKGDLNNGDYVTAFNFAEALVIVLKQCGDNLTRANVMAKAANLDAQLAMLQLAADGSTRLRTSPTDYQPMKKFWLIESTPTGWFNIKDFASE